MAPASTSRVATSSSADPKMKKSDNPNFLYLACVRGAIAQRRRGYRKQLYYSIAELCDIGEHLKTQMSEWRKLVKADWGTLKPPKITDQDNALRHVIRWAIGTSGMGEKNASFYYRAVTPLVAGGLRGEALVKALQNEGFKKQQAQHSRGRKRAESAPTDKPSRPKAAAQPTTASTEDEAVVREVPLSDGDTVVKTELRLKAIPNNFLGMKAGSRVKITGNGRFEGSQFIVDPAKIKIMK